MDTQSVTENLPPYVEDLRKNFVLAMDSEDLTVTQRVGSALAAALCCRQPQAITEIEQLAAQHLDAKTLQAAKGAATMMAANNIYWRFWYLVDDKEYLDIKPEFSESIFSRHGIAEVDFTCFVVAASAINNCAGCLKVHSRKLLKLGFTKAQVMHVVRIAAAVHSLAVTMAGRGTS